VLHLTGGGIKGVDVPIRAILENDHAFGPEDVASLTAAFEAALSRMIAETR
jgi:hypothetical protein